MLQQQGGQVEAGPQAEPLGQGQGQGLAIEAGAAAGVGLGRGDAQVQQQFVAFGMGLGWTVLEAAPQQGNALGQVPFAHLEAAELGAGVGVVGPLLQLLFHGLTQALGLAPLGQEFRPVAIVEQGWHAAIGHPPVGLQPLQLGHAFINAGVVGPAPADRRMAAKQATNAGIGGLAGAHFQAQQVDQQHIRLGHQGP